MTVFSKLVNNFSPQVRTPADGKWKSFTEPRPYVTVSGFAYDSKGTFPIIYRSDKVRSAKNCWAVPSGLHEVGLSLDEQFAAELQEELNLEPVTGKADIVGVYENIAEVDSWHWVIIVVTMRVKTLDTMINKEPDRHTEIRKIELKSLMDDSLIQLPWAPSLGTALEKYRLKIYESIYLGVK